MKSGLGASGKAEPSSGRSGPRFTASFGEVAGREGGEQTVVAVRVEGAVEHTLSQSDTTLWNVIRLCANEICLIRSWPNRSYVHGPTNT